GCANEGLDRPVSRSCGVQGGCQARALAFSVANITPEVGCDAHIERLPDLRDAQKDAVASRALGRFDLAKIDQPAAAVGLEPVAVPAELIDRVVGELIHEAAAHA